MLLNQINGLFYNSVNQRELLISTLNSKEHELFFKITKELMINFNNLPGFFSLAFRHSYLMRTPSFVWQTWLYHRFIHEQTLKQNKEYPMISLEHIYNDMCQLINKGYFVMHSNYNQTLLKYLIIEWSKAYENLGVIVSKSKTIKEVKYDSIPIFNTVQDNISIELFYNNILPHYNYQFDFQDDTIPYDLKRAVYIFENSWKNLNNGYSIKQEFKISSSVSSKKKSFNNTQLIIYTDNKSTLKDALDFLKDEHKLAIAAYLKSGNTYSTEEICEFLIRDFKLNSNKDHEGKYQIYSFVDEYIFSSLWLWDN